MPCRRVVHLQTPLVEWHDVTLLESQPDWSESYRAPTPRLLMPRKGWLDCETDRHVDRRMLLWMVVGAGLPFGFAAMSGTRFAPSSHMGVLMAGASPLIAAGLAWWVWREALSGSRRVGMAFMLAAVMLLGAQTLLDWSTATWRGDLLFLLAALLWAVYTVTFKRTGLSPWHAAALVNVWSFLLVLAPRAAALWTECNPRSGTRRPFSYHADALLRDTAS